MDRNQEIHIEKDFWDDFIVEAFEHIDSIESNAMDLEKNPENTEIIHTMFRAFHTIKGLSGFVEHTIIQEVAHKTETMMDLCRKGELKVNTQIVDAILKSSDYIKQLCNSIEAYNDGTLIDNIEKLLVVLEDLSTIGEQEPKEQPQETTDFKEETTKEETVTDEQATCEPSQDGLEAFANDAAFFEDENKDVQEEKEIQDIEIENKQEEEINQEPEVIQETEETELQIEGTTPPKEEDKELKTFQANIMEKLNGNIAIKETVKEEIKESTTKQVSANEEYMKVANYKIDHLVEMMGELIINQALIEQYVALNYSNDRQLVANMSGFLRITRELQNLSMSLRMVSLKSTFQKLTRIARDTIQELKKDVEFVMDGEGTEIDRAVAEKLLDPLVHMIKNAISHGIEENSEDRVNIGKPQKATVELNAYSKRGKIFIEVKDDGKGINTEIVYNKALEKGIIEPNRTYSEAEIREFIMLPGFSTAKVVDNISGRGVGMDVVRTQVNKLGGKIDIQSGLNKGSTFTLEVPVNHAIINGTIIEMNEQHFVVPTVNVKEFLQPEESQWIFTKGVRTMIKVRDNIIPIVPITTFFKNAEEPKQVPLLMVLELEQELRAIPITNVINRQEVVVKPVGEEFAHLKFISGMSILGTGKVSLILDIDYLFRKETEE